MQARISDRALNSASYHESGHAVVGFLLSGKIPLFLHVDGEINRKGVINWGGGRVRFEQNDLCTDAQNVQNAFAGPFAEIRWQACSEHEAFDKPPLVQPSFISDFIAQARALASDPNEDESEIEEVRVMLEINSPYPFINFWVHNGEGDLDIVFRREEKVDIYKLAETTLNLINSQPVWEKIDVIARRVIAKETIAGSEQRVKKELSQNELKQILSTNEAANLVLKKNAELYGRLS